MLIWVKLGLLLLQISFPGDIFCSPPPDIILNTIKELSRRNVHGTLVIISNKLSDKLNFGLAVEKASNIDNVKIKMITVNDEIKDPNENSGHVGTILIQKIAGAMSEKGFFLNEIYDYCLSIMEDIATVSVSIKSPKSPYAKISTTAKTLASKEMEFCMGNHGEIGIGRMPLKTTSETVKILLGQILGINGKN